jgi:hypothetical protein
LHALLAGLQITAEVLQSAADNCVFDGDALVAPLALTRFRLANSQHASETCLIVYHDVVDDK